MPEMCRNLKDAYHNHVNILAQTFFHAYCTFAHHMP